jgi:hypothetical protein
LNGRSAAGRMGDPDKIGAMANEAVGLLGKLEAALDVRVHGPRMTAGQMRQPQKAVCRTGAGWANHPGYFGRSPRRAQRPNSLPVVARAASIPRVAGSAGPVGWSARLGLTIVSFRQACKRR